jgi:ATP-dependent DNA ligase
VFAHACRLGAEGIVSKQVGSSYRSGPHPAWIKTKNPASDGEAVVIGPDGIAQFDELRRRNGAEHAMLYGFDLIELNGVDLRGRPFLERKTALADLIGGTKAGIMLNDHITADGDRVFAHACRLGAEGIVSKQVGSSYRSGPHPAWIKTKNPASTAVQRERSHRLRTRSDAPVFRRSADGPNTPLVRKGR